MNEKTIETLNILEKRAEYKRMSEEVRVELLKMIGELKEEVLAIVSGAIENEQFHAELSEVSEFELDEPTSSIDWYNFRSEGSGSKEEKLDENFKPKRDPRFHAMDRFA